MIFANHVRTASEQLSRVFGVLVDQRKLAALSISANIAEGNGPSTKADRKNFFIIARGSVQECVPLLEIARRCGLLYEAKQAELKSQLEEISKMLLDLINGFENRKFGLLIMHGCPKKFNLCPATPIFWA